MAGAPQSIHPEPDSCLASTFSHKFGQTRVRIRSNLFIWVFVATILPLTALALGATYFSESTYQAEVSRDMTSHLERLAAELKLQMDNYRQLTEGMARAPAIQQALPILNGIRLGQLDVRLNVQRSRINHYFEGFQTILKSGYFMRLMDSKGNSLVKVSHVNRSAPVYESVTGIAYVEQEISSDGFAKRLRQLPKGEASPVTLPHHQFYTDVAETLKLYDYVVPLYYHGRFVGALSLTLVGEQLDQVMRNASRLFQGKLFILQHSPDDPEHHGLLLYDDRHDLHFVQRQVSPVRAKDFYPAAMIEAFSEVPIGNRRSEDGKFQYFFMELFPYSHLLSNWMLVTQIDSKVISAPFQQIRWVIWLCAGIALLISLMLANVGGVRVSNPIKELTGKLLDYAKGHYHGRFETRRGIDEIDALTDAFNYMADSIQRSEQGRQRAENMMLQSAKLASIGQMAAGIGHELNNPLNNILSYAKLLERSSKGDATLQDDIRSLREEALRASEIVKGILNFARQVPPQYSQFNVNEWLESTLALVQQTARSKSISLDLQPDYEGILEGDRGQLQQVLVNLLLNAIQSSARDSHIRIETVVQHDLLHLRVIDEGEGIDEAVLGKIYDPFFTTKTEGDGSGLGLSICLGIIERHHGTLDIRNNQGRGVTATVTLPLHSDNYS